MVKSNSDEGHMTCQMRLLGLRSAIAHQISKHQMTDDVTNGTYYNNECERNSPLYIE